MGIHLVPILLNASKLAGVLATLSVTANTIAYIRFRKNFLEPLDNPLDESEEVLAAFDTDKNEDDGGFFFGLATAPAHVEDNLHDAWLEFAENDSSDSNPQPNHPTPKIRRSKGGVEEPKLQFIVPKKWKKTLKIPIEAMIRGFERYSEKEEEEKCHNVAAWQNTYHP